MKTSKLTEEEIAVFQAIVPYAYENIALVRAIYRDEEVAVIVVEEEDAETADASVYPVYMSITPSIFADLVDPNTLDEEDDNQLTMEDFWAETEESE